MYPNQSNDGSETELTEPTPIHIQIRPNRFSLLTVGLTVWLALSLGFALAGVAMLSTLVLATAVGAACALMVYQLHADIYLIGDEVRIHYWSTSFVDSVANLADGPGPKYDFRHDETKGLKRLWQGTRLIGFYVGWYSLNDDSPAFVCLTRKHRARRFKTTDGVSLVLDPGVARQLDNALPAT